MRLALVASAGYQLRMPPRRLHLVDLDAELVAAWQVAFRAQLDVTIQRGDILAIAHGALVSPANSYGHMDGGIDRQYLEVLGWQLQRVVYTAVRARPEGMIPVGAAELIGTGHPRVPYLIVAPTMELPEPVPASHSCRALRAALRAASKLPDEVVDVYCPGLATGVGCVAPQDAAREMAAAYEAWRAESR